MAKEEMDELAEEFELTPEEMEEILDMVEDFEDKFLTYLADSDNYELVPTTDPNGKPLSKKQFELVRKKCSSFGAKCLYVIEQGKDTVIINPKTLKIGIVNHEEVH